MQLTDSGAANSVRCYGLYSCAFVDNIYVINGYVDCYAELSCFRSTITFLDSDDHFYCYGDRSCAQATMYNYWYVYVTGHLAAQNATFYSMATNVNYFFRGVSSGNGAEIICQSGDNCNVNCFTNACNNLTLTCNGCNAIRLSCYGEASGVCKDETSALYTILTWEAVDAEYELPDLSNITMSSYENSFDACLENKTNAINVCTYISLKICFILFWIIFVFHLFFVSVLYFCLYSYCSVEIIKIHNALEIHWMFQI